MNQGILYEPRSLWSVVAPDPGRSSFPREHFLNGERYPITLTRIAMALLGDVELANYQATYAIASTTVQLIISAPQRQNYSRYPVAIGFTAARGQPATALTNSSLWGVSALAFDKPLYLPPRGSIEMGLTGKLLDSDAEAEDVYFSALFQSEGGLATGASRTQPPTLLVQGAYSTFVKFDPTQAYSPPVLDDAAVTQGVNGTFPSTARMNARTFDQQNPVRNSGEKLTRLSILLDQLNPDAVEPSTPLALNVGSRIRTVDGGSNQEWWRPGAPLALTHDAITPAFVYPLPEPITVGPGDTLDVELEFTTLGPPHAIGISFNGYAAIEG